MPVDYETGTSLIYAPAKIGYEIQARLVGPNTHFFDGYSGIMFTSCAEKSEYETLYLWIDDFRFEISVDDYWIDYNDLIEDVEDYDPAEADTCLLAIIDGFHDWSWTVGNAFLKGYYTIHDNSDHANAKMGFAPHATSSKSKVEKLPKPTIDVLDIVWETTWIGFWANPSKPRLGVWEWFGNIWLSVWGIYDFLLL